MPSLSGWVIAGGKSSRMGQDKAAMEYHGKMMLAHAIEKLQAVAGNVGVCGGSRGLAAGVLVIEDRFQCGPLGGIVSVLEASSTDWNLVLPVDMPLIPTAWLKTLVACAQKSEAKALVTCTEGRAQPLVAAYHRDLSGALRACILHQNYKVMNALKSVTKVDYLEAADAKLFVNVNTPKEFAALPDANTSEEVMQ